MLKVVIIDDEVLVRVGLKSMVNWNELGCEIVGDADNGESGYELIKNTRPDVVITDIKMPVMDGLQLIEKTRETYREIKFIVLSSYDEFHLVKQAMKLGTEEYLIKLDIDPQKVTEVIRQVADKIHAETLVKDEQSKLEMHMRRNRQVLIEEFFKRLIGRLIPSKNDLYDTIHHLEIKLKEDRLFCAVMNLYDVRNQGRYPTEEDIELLGFCVLNITDEITNDYFTSYTVRMDAEKFAIIFSMDESLERKLFKEKVDKMCSRIIDMLNQYVGITVSIGVSNQQTGFLELSQAYNEAFRACEHSFFVGLGRVILYSEISGKQEKTGVFSEQNYRNELSRALELQDIKEIEAAVDRIIGTLKHEGVTRGQAYDLCYQTAYAVMDSGHFKSDDVKSILGAGKSLYENIMRSNTLPEIIGWLEKLKNAIVAEIVAGKDSDYNGKLIAAAKKYINDNYHKDLTLSDVASAINISHCHFSTLFKNIVGVNFVDYVTGVKMTHAKRLLLENDRKIYEVASLLGYENAYYFSRVFKKVTGMTPSEFIEKKY